jgi:hypothetical protein
MRLKILIMKNLLITISLIIISTCAYSQILSPVKWSYAAKKLDNKHAVVFIKATIDDEWHIYSQHGRNGGPVKTSFTFPNSKEYVLDGPTMEPKPKTVYEQAFNMNVSYFENSVIFQQKLTLKKAGPVEVKGALEFMTCNDEKCLPPDQVDFSIQIK